MKNVIARHLVRYLAVAQAGPVVILHGAWLILATATWSHASGADSGAAEAMRTLMRGYAWLGGLDEYGHGNGTTLLAVWGKLSLAVYLLDAALRALRGPASVPARPPRSVWWWGALSGLATLLGMGFALWPMPEPLLELAPMLLLFAALSAAAAVWAVFTRRLSERLVMPAASPSTPPTPAA